METELFGWGEDEINKVTQTEFTKHELSTKIETIIVKNEFKAKTSQDCVKIVNKLSYEVVAKDSNHMKHETFCRFNSPSHVRASLPFSQSV